MDISATALEEAGNRLTALEGVTVRGFDATFEEGLRRLAEKRSSEKPLLILFLGSNLGNFDPVAARVFLEEIRGVMRPGDRLLLGVDLIKGEEELLLAYDDPLGVTAAFNKNLLVRMNRELGAAFPIQEFTHRALWNPSQSRMEMHLVARRALRVEILELGIVASFEEGESIFTESSYKFELDSFRRLASSAALEVAQSWVDESARYALILLRPA